MTAAATGVDADTAWTFCTCGGAGASATGFVGETTGCADGAAVAPPPVLGIASANGGTTAAAGFSWPSTGTGTSSIGPSGSAAAVPSSACAKAGSDAFDDGLDVVGVDFCASPDVLAADAALAVFGVFEGVSDVGADPPFGDDAVAPLDADDDAESSGSATATPAPVPRTTQAPTAKETAPAFSALFVTVIFAFAVERWRGHYVTAQRVNR